MKSLWLVLLIVFVLGNEFKNTENLLRHHTHQPNQTNPNHEKLFSDNVIEVHLIPHSHDDVGWLKTVDEYYFGQHNNIQWAGVQYIIDSYVFALLNDPNKKFIQVETAFFKKWWDTQPEHMKQQVKGLVANGQLEFINGGWCMNDEATTYYEDIIDQMTLGHKFIYETFGVRPTIGWHIDPFGHQASQASIFSQMGFDGWFFSRIDYQDQEKRMETQQMEMIMTPFQASGEDNSIFSHVNYFQYRSPPGFDFNGRQTDEPIIDNPEAKDFNLFTKAEQFVQYFRNQSTHYRGNLVLHTMGEDFYWDAAPIFFKNLDKLMNHINNNSTYNMKILYSNPKLYLEALHKQNLSYPTKSDDFFPYADVPHGYWTGYFTSRVSIKAITRYYGRYSSFIHKVFTTNFGHSPYFKSNETQIKEDLVKLEEAMGILQHHDAVAGTAKQHVTDDYIKTLLIAVDNVNKHLEGVLKERTKLTNFKTCNWNATSTECEITFNELSNKRPVQIVVMDQKVNQKGEKERIRVKVPDVPLKIVDQDNQPVKGETVCLPFTDGITCDLYFLFVNQGPMHIAQFKIVPVSTKDASVTKLSVSNQRAFFAQNKVEIQIDDAPKFALSYGYYKSYQDQGQKSGAYIFRAENNMDISKPYSHPLLTQEFNGKIVKNVVIYGQNTRTIVRKFNTKLFKSTYEIETFVDSIQVDDGVGKEIVLLIDTKINSGNTFYTDSNGLELQKRVINHRDTWDLEIVEWASGNYYPVNGMLMLKSLNSSDVVALLNDRSQGGTSLQNGQIEMMIHRRTIMDDSRGVGEPLNEVSEEGYGLRQSIIHQLAFFNTDEQPNLHRKLQLYMDSPPYTFLAQTKKAEFDLEQDQEDQPISSPIAQLLDQQDNSNSLVKYFIQLWGKNQYLFRAHNMQEVGSVRLNFPNSFTYEETILTGTQSWSEWQSKKLTWNIDGVSQRIPQDCSRKTLELKPLQIRTFILTQVKESLI